MSAHCLPIKSQNCQERRLQVQHFTLLFQMQNIGFGSTGVCRKGNFDILGEKVVVFLPFSFPPPHLFLYSCSVFWSWEFTGPHFRGKRFGELKTYGFRRKNCRWVVEDFHHHFRLNVTYFFVFLSGFLDLIVLAFYSIFILLLCHTE